MARRTWDEMHRVSLETQKHVPRMCSPQAFNLQTRQSDQVRLGFTACLDVQDGVPDLFDDNRAPAEARLLCAVAFENQTFVLLLDMVGCDRRVMRDLLRVQLQGALVPASDELFAEETVERCSAIVSTPLLE